MTAKPRQICSYPGCDLVVESGRCAKHRRIAQKRPKTASRGYGGRWQRLRLMILRRAGDCALRYAGCTRIPTEVDHIVPLSQGGTNHMSNLQGVCKHCHSHKTALEDGAFGNPRKGEGGQESPQPTDS